MIIKFAPVAAPIPSACEPTNNLGWAVFTLTFMASLADEEAAETMILARAQALAVGEGMQITTVVPRRGRTQLTIVRRAAELPPWGAVGIFQPPQWEVIEEEKV